MYIDGVNEPPLFTVYRLPSSSICLLTSFLCFRKISGLFARAIVGHRDEFQRFHRNKRNIASRTAKAVKTHLEGLELRKEKQENKEGISCVDEDDVVAVK